MCRFINIYQFLSELVQMNLILVYKVNKTVKWLAQKPWSKALFPAQENTFSSSILQMTQNKVYWKEHSPHLTNSFSDLYDGNLSTNMESLPHFPASISHLFSVFISVSEKVTEYTSTFTNIFKNEYRTMRSALWLFMSNDLDDN